MLNLLFRVIVWLAGLIAPSESLPIGNVGTGEPGSYKKARGCLADDFAKQVAQDELHDYPKHYDLESYVKALIEVGDLTSDKDDDDNE